MKTFNKIMLLLIVLTALNCQKNQLPTSITKEDGGSLNMSDLVISKGFNWKTTKDINFEIKLPQDNPNDLITISDESAELIFFEGYGLAGKLNFNSLITIPAYIGSLKIQYGESGQYPVTIVDADEYLNIDLSGLAGSRSICGCDDGLRSLSLHFNGSTASAILVKEESTGNILFDGIVDQEADFSFTGSSGDGKMDEIINIYVDGNYNSSIITNCSVDLFAGDVYGSFIISSGITANYVPLCDHKSGNPLSIGYSGTLAFEDLWPSAGDYDFNDLVISYDFDITKNSVEEIEKIEATFTLDALGASFYNGFGFSFPGVKPNQISSVSGYALKSSSIVSLLSNGVEANQSDATLIVFDDCFDLLKHPGIGNGINTDPQAPYIEPVSIKLVIDFIANGTIPPGGTINFKQLNIGHFNPFLIVDQDRGKEIHLPYFPPTDLANSNYFGKWDDDSNIAGGRYYLTENNYPWAINIPGNFDYPIETIDINNAYNFFKNWTESEGDESPGWFHHSKGYRNNEYIYKVH
ncbi:MAG: LruC domain-containing protein [Chlorobi bacterium]|nr:LruC domain-containing protein [Chlorobiota bacterium]